MTLRQEHDERQNLWWFSEQVSMFLSYQKQTIGKPEKSSKDQWNACIKHRINPMNISGHKIYVFKRLQNSYTYFVQLLHSLSHDNILYVISQIVL